MSAMGRVYAAACELIDGGYSVQYVINVLVRDYGVSRSFAGSVVDSIVGDNW